MKITFVERIPFYDQQPFSSDMSSGTSDSMLQMFAIQVTRTTVNFTRTRKVRLA